MSDVIADSYERAGRVRRPRRLRRHTQRVPEKGSRYRPHLEKKTP